ncbi:uncharacterized protein Dwil_GK12737 [Drosophila willistoni]|uniref:MAGE domain-containing protein n=1 Tax=Drosophila willistoni TaxID=7260 RepID=B4NKV1_DROWI|nr:non-structural maintenance of chromosomes element 3 homolog [Drosophila willistoni]EDW85202.1 uncharacterized protein Dwil_GK12737 [Drosophila willistoni]
MASTSRSYRNSQRASQSQNREQQRVGEEVKSIVKFILDHSAEKVAIKEKDMHVVAGGKDMLRQHLPLVVEELKRRFGIAFRLLDTSTPQNKVYICVATSPMVSIYELTESQRPQFTLLLIILLYIFLRDNRIEDQKLYEMLALLNIRLDEEHGYFGNDLKKLIEETFVRQHYLKRERSELSAYDDPKVYFQWGLRAKAEFSYPQMIQFASKLFQQDPKYIEQRLKATQSQQEQAEQ